MAKKGWTEAEERIIAWAQLSGITAADFVRIGARIKRDENIARHAVAVERSMQGTVIEPFKDGWLFTTSHPQSFKHNGKAVKCGQFYISKIQAWPRVYQIQVLNSQGEAFATAKFTSNRWLESQYPNRIYPLKNKELFLVAQAVQRHQLDWKNIRKPQQILTGDMT